MGRTAALSSGVYRRCFGFLRAPFVLVERLHVQGRQPPKLCPVLGGVNTSSEPLALPIRHLAAPALLLRAHGFDAFLVGGANARRVNRIAGWRYAYLVHSVPPLVTVGRASGSGSFRGIGYPRIIVEVRKFLQSHPFKGKRVVIGIVADHTGTRLPPYKRCTRSA